MEAVLPSGPFGERVRRRLRGEIVAWLTTVGADGTPQPNPVWFLWDGSSSLLVYNRSDAARLRHLEQRANVALNLDGNGQGGDIVVLTGRAERDDSVASAAENVDYLAKYRLRMERVSGS